MGGYSDDFETGPDIGEHWTAQAGFSWERRLAQWSYLTGAGYGVRPYTGLLLGSTDFFLTWDTPSGGASCASGANVYLEYDESMGSIPFGGAGVFIGAAENLSSYYLLALRRDEYYLDSYVSLERFAEGASTTLYSYAAGQAIYQPFQIRLSGGAISIVFSSNYGAAQAVTVTDPSPLSGRYAGVFSRVQGHPGSPVGVGFIDDWWLRWGEGERPVYTVVDFGHATFFPCVNLTADTSEAFTENEGILDFSTYETQDLGDGVLLVGDHIASSGGAQSSNTPTSSDTPQSSDAPESSQNPQSSAPPASSNPPESSDAPQSSAPPASSNPPESSDVPQSSAAPASSNLLQSSAQPESSAPLASSNPPQTSTPPASSNPPQSSAPPASSAPPNSSNTPNSDNGSTTPQSSTSPNSSNTPNSDNGSSAATWYCVAYTKYDTANCSGTAVAYGATCMSFSEASSKSGTCENVSGDGYESIHWADDLNYVGWEVTGPHGSDFCEEYCNFETPIQYWRVDYALYVLCTECPPDGILVDEQTWCLRTGAFEEGCEYLDETEECVILSNVRGPYDTAAECNAVSP